MIQRLWNLYCTVCCNIRTHELVPHATLPDKVRCRSCNNMRWIPK